MFKNIFAVLLLLPLQLQAQPNGYTTVKNTSALQQALVKHHIGTTSVMADFTQIKKLRLLSESLKSNGKFYFKQKEKLRIQYTSPYLYLFIYNNGQMLVKDESKANKINAKNSKAMQSLNHIMLDCMGGTIFSNTDFQVQSFENKGNYLLQLIPLDAAIKKLYTKIEVGVVKATYDVDKIVMTEQGGDITEMKFYNTQNNTALNDALFKVK